jgi:hypothetical protein
MLIDVIESFNRKSKLQRNATPGGWRRNLWRPPSSVVACEGCTGRHLAVHPTCGHEHWQTVRRPTTGYYNANALLSNNSPTSNCLVLLIGINLRFQGVAGVMVCSGLHRVRGGEKNRDGVTSNRPGPCGGVMLGPIEPSKCRKNDLLRRANTNNRKIHQQQRQQSIGDACPCEPRSSSSRLNCTWSASRDRNSDEIAPTAARMCVCWAHCCVILCVVVRPNARYSCRSIFKCRP